MTLTDLKVLINTTLTTVGAETGATDTFSWVDTGKTIQSLSASDFKTFLNKFALGVIRSEFDTRVWKKTLDIMTDSQTYEGIKQFIKASPLSAEDTSIIALVNGQDYTDGVYRDLTTHELLTTKDESIQFAWSIPQTELTTLFSDETSAMRYVELINATVTTSFNRAKWVIQLSTLDKLILSAHTANREVNLVTLYNASHTPTVTSADCLNNVDFKRWACEVVANLKEFMTDISSKYNDGATTPIDTFVPYEDIRLTMLTQFSNALKNVSNYESVPALSWGEYNTVNAWQSTGNNLLPTIAESGMIGDSVTSESVDNVVGVVYDKYAVGMTIRAEKVTSSYIAKGDFTNFYGTFVAQSFVNNMNNAVILTLN